MLNTSGNLKWTENNKKRLFSFYNLSKEHNFILSLPPSTSPTQVAKAPPKLSPLSMLVSCEVHPKTSDVISPSCSKGLIYI